MTQVNTRANHSASVAQLTALSAQVDALQGQISTGKRVVSPADDPIAFTRTTALRRAEAANETGSRAIDAATRRLSTTDTALSGVSDIVLRTKELALQGANGTLSADDRASLKAEVTELAKRAASLAETRDDDGARVFGGAAADGPAYASDLVTGARVWQGGGHAPGPDIGGATIATGLTGPEAFGVDDASVFATLDALAKTLAEPDAIVRAAGFDSVLTNLDGLVSRLADSRATAGARLARLDSENQRIAAAKLDTETGLTQLEGLDLTEAIARLQRLSTVLQAAQGSFVRVNALSLWEQLR